MYHVLVPESARNPVRLRADSSSTYYFENIVLVGHRHGWKCIARRARKGGREEEEGEDEEDEKV